MKEHNVLNNLPTSKATKNENDKINLTFIQENIVVTVITSILYL